MRASNGSVERDKKNMKPLIFKLGVALVLSIAGFFASRFGSRPSLPPPAASSSGDETDNGGEFATVGAVSSGGDELSEEALAKRIHATTTTNDDMGPSSIHKSSEDEEEFLLPEFHQIVARQFEASWPDLETSVKTPMNDKFEIKDNKMEQEIAYLRNMVQCLQQREKSLEFQMLDYCGLKEQEATTVRELENMLKINTTELKLLSLKIESLQDENQKFRIQVSEYSRVMTELESARAMIELLKRKLKSDGEQVREKIAFLQQRIATLQENERREGKNYAEVESKLKKLEVLEEVTAELRNENLRLVQENLDLVQKFESTQMISSSTVETPEADVLEQICHLRQENSNLAGEIEQLQTDRCADVEELVYLRWINACLRYELRNYQTPPGKTVARDLSRSLSPKSEEKAKQLILEYANLSTDEKNISVVDFASESCSSSQTSTGECDDTSFDVSLSTKNSSPRKSKFISKLKKLVSGKGRHGGKNSLVDKTHTNHGDLDIKGSVSTCSLDDMIGRNSSDSISSCFSMEHASSSHLIGMESHVNEKW